MLRGRLREFGGAKHHRGSRGPENVCSLIAQTTRRSNLALAGRRFNHIFTDSYNKFSRLTLKKWENKFLEFRFTNLVSFYIPRNVPNSQLIELWTDLPY